MSHMNIQESQAYPQCPLHSTCLGYQSCDSQYMYLVSQSLEICFPRCLMVSWKVLLSKQQLINYTHNPQTPSHFKSPNITSGL
jgi:hypothetical protein